MPNEIIREDDEDVEDDADVEGSESENLLNDIDEDSVYSSTDYFRETSTDYANESDYDIFDTSIHEPVREIDEDIYDSDEQSENSDLSDSENQRKKEITILI